MSVMYMTHFPDDVEHSGIDHTGPLPLNEDIDNLEIPEPTLAISSCTRVTFPLHIWTGFNDLLTFTLLGSLLIPFFH